MQDPTPMVAVRASMLKTLSDLATRLSNPHGPTGGPATDEENAAIDYADDILNGGIRPAGEETTTVVVTFGPGTDPDTVEATLGRLTQNGGMLIRAYGGDYVDSPDRFDGVDLFAQFVGMDADGFIVEGKEAHYGTADETGEWSSLVQTESIWIY